MLAEVGQYVNQRRAYLPRRSERPAMPTVGPEPPPAPDQRIDRASNPDGDAAHPARERLPIVGLDQQVNMVVLDRILDDSESLWATPVGASDGEA